MINKDIWEPAKTKHVAHPLVIGKVNGSILGPSCVIAKKVKSCTTLTNFVQSKACLQLLGSRAFVCP